MREFSSSVGLPRHFGRYLLHERIGGGGMATVYRATFSVEGGFEKEIALKVIRSELSEDPQFIRMFLDEARLSGHLSHPNIVQTFDFGQVEGTYYLAMELVRGRTLAEILRTLRDNRLRLGTAASLFVAKELARALDYAHRATGPDGEPLGIVHRDVSPQNVLVSREGHVKLADFGIAKAALRSQITQPGRVRGKCSYMAPEQARGQEVDARADVFSLGTVLWECLVGRRLFDGASDAQVLLDVIQKEIPPPSSLVRGIPPDVDRVVMRLLERDPARRPTSGAAFRELADLSFRLARSPEDLDLFHLQQKLASATAAVSRPEIELSTWRSSDGSAYPWPVDPEAKTVVSDEDWMNAPTLVSEGDPPRSRSDDHRPSGVRRTLTLSRTHSSQATAEREAPRWGKALAPVAVASALGAMLGIATMVAWKPWATAPALGPAAEEIRDAESTSPKESADPYDVPLARGEALGVKEPFTAPAESAKDGAPEPTEERVEIVAQTAGESSEYRHVDVSNSRPASPMQAPRAENRTSAPPTSTPLDAASSPSPPVAKERPGPTKETPPPATQETGTLVLTSRLPGARVTIDDRDAFALAAMSPHSTTVPAGQRQIVFVRDEDDFRCRVSVRVVANERVAILLDRDGVYALRGLERTSLPCG
nr:MAG: serine/threonine protein kinase [Pseudomonadota bacterium]